MHLESIFYPKDWQMLSADDLDLGTGNPVVVDGFVLQIGKSDIAYLLRQGHLGGEEGEVASLSMCSGGPTAGTRLTARSSTCLPEWCDGGQGVDEVPLPETDLERQQRHSWHADRCRRARLDDRQQRRARPQPDRWPPGRIDTVRRVHEPLPDAFGWRWPAAPSRYRSSLGFMGPPGLPSPPPARQGQLISRFSSHLTWVAHDEARRATAVCRGRFSGSRWWPPNPQSPRVDERLGEIRGLFTVRRSMAQTTAACRRRCTVVAHH